MTGSFNSYESRFFKESDVGSLIFRKAETKTIVSSGYTVLPTRRVAKAITNSILESPDDPKQRNEDSVGIRTMALLFL